MIIYNFSGKSLPNLDRLHNLELLVISECSNLNAVPDFIFKLPNLKYLGLRGLTNLKAIPTEINNIPGLQYLELMKAEDAGFYELPEFRNGLFVHKMVSWNSYERIN